MIAHPSQAFPLNAEDQVSPWWIEVRTYQPACTYFFGPFDSRNEAIWHQSGFLEDIQEEQPMGMMINIHQAEPDQLTLFDE